MIAELQKPEVVKFILEHEQADINQLLLKHKTILGIPATVIVDQIRGRQKAKEKLPTLYHNTQIIYPPGLNLEQSSSELTAKFKWEFVRNLFGKNTPQQGADLTGGFGIDACFMSNAFSQYHFVEPNPKLISIAQLNHITLSAKNIAYENLKAEEFLKSFSGKLDFVYIDPSRRLTNNQKVFSLAECEPNIVANQTEILSKTDRLMIKASPLLDLQIGMKELHHIKKVIVLSVENECKEVLFYCEKNFNEPPMIEAINLSDRSSMASFEFSLTEEKTADAKFASPKEYLYEPNASILKAGAFKLIGNRFGLSKLHPSTHLYTSTQLHQDFPGRVFRIISIVKPEPKALKDFFPDGKANVTTRNYPQSVAELKKKTGLKDGGEKFLIGFTDIEKKGVAVAERIK